MPNRRKKDMQYLEEIGMDNTTMPWEHGNEPFSDTGLFLGHYTERDLKDLMEGAGLMDLIRKKGYSDLIFTMTRQDFTSRLYVNYENTGKETRLIELIIREGVFRPKQAFIERFDFQEGLSIILVEWLALQDPKAIFTPERPKLPGQAHPGLGGLRNMQEILYTFGKQCHKDAIVDVPQHYHAAVIYSRLYTSIYARMYAFYSPVDAGLFQALTRDLEGRPLAEISRAIALGCLLNTVTGKHETWRPSEQLYAVTQPLYDYFESPEYREIVEKTAAKVKYAIDWDKYSQALEQGVPDDL
jgi:hypothetical protein